MLGSRTANLRIRVASSSGLVGGPIEVESTISFTNAPVYVLLSGDRDAWKIVGSIAGVTLADPFPGYFYSGPCFPKLVEPSAPLVQTMNVADCVALEDALDVVADGASAELTLDVTRQLSMGPTEKAAMSAPTEPLFREVLTIELHRDDAALTALVDKLVGDIEHGPRELRYEAMRKVVTIRAPLAIERWSRLAHHPEPAVSETVRSTLDYRRQMRR